MTEEISPPYTKEPVGSGERVGGVIKTRVLVIQLTARLLAEIWKETWSSVVLFHNESPTRRNEWIPPTIKFNRWLRANGRDVPEVEDQPDHSNKYAYRSMAFALKDSIKQEKEKVKAKT